MSVPHEPPPPGGRESQPPGGGESQPPGPPHPDPERLTLAALPAEPDDPTVAAHLVGCARCRSEVADLRRVVELAREGGVADALPAPPPQVWRGIAAELGLPGERNGQVDATARGPLTDGPIAGASDDRSPTWGNGDGAPVRPADPAEGGPAQAPPSRPRRRRVLVPLVAAVVGLAAGLGVGRAVAPEPAPVPVAGPVARLAPVGRLDPGASGTVAMADDHGEREMVVQVQGVTDIGSGDHLEAWLMDTSGTRLVPLGALAGGGGAFHGTFALPNGLPLGQFGRVDVSAEKWDGNPGHSTISVLRGDCCS